MNDDDNHEQDISFMLNENGYEILETLGSGSFATVYKVRSKKYDQVFAAKVFHLLNSEDDQQALTYSNEVGLMEQVQHPNIINIYAHFKYKTQFCIILEYCGRGSLKDMIDDGVVLQHFEYLNIINQILNALAYLHQNNITHGDIKPANILFDNYLRPKLGDFGFAQMNNDTRQLNRNFSCSPAFAAPEVLLRKPFDPFKADMWSFGITCYYFWTGKMPFNTNSVMAMITSMKNNNLYVADNNELQQIVNNTLLEDFRDRLSAAVLLKCKVFNIQTTLKKTNLPSINRNPSPVSVKLSHVKSMKLGSSRSGVVKSLSGYNINKYLSFVHKHKASTPSYLGTNEMVPPTVLAPIDRGNNW